MLRIKVKVSLFYLCPVNLTFMSNRLILCCLFCFILIIDYFLHQDVLSHLFYSMFVLLSQFVVVSPAILKHGSFLSSFHYYLVLTWWGYIYIYIYIYIFLSVHFNNIISLILSYNCLVFIRVLFLISELFTFCLRFGGLFTLCGPVLWLVIL